MIKIKLRYFISISICLSLVELIIASNSDGFCTVIETYVDPGTGIETYTETVQVSKACNIFSSACYEPKNVERIRKTSYQVTRTRMKKQCCDGYTFKENSCIPKCILPCRNGQCTGPNQCTCNPGYEKYSIFSGFSRCKPKCKDGFKYNIETTACDPVCSQPCLNGVCSEPEICTCSSGYHKNIDGICIENECDSTSIMSKKCGNGKCTNGVCLCNEGYLKNTTSVECEPICDSCINGICVAPKKCICLDGFEWNESGSKCVRKCLNGCFNGKCDGDGNCVCNPRYEAVNSSVCSPICKKACIYGTCTEPNSCTCFEGYQLQHNSYHICEPICSSDCSNGICVKPNLCQCDNGFKFNEDSKKCEAVCDIECVNSNCTSPNTCTCQIGFSKLNSTYCEILCENCTNGHCEEPNVCQCDIGYYLNNNKCVEKRSTTTEKLVETSTEKLVENCENGYVSHGYCVCNMGYKRNTPHTCVAICSLECVNGYCSEPEVCQCYDGYELHTTIGRDKCINCNNLNNICYPISDSTTEGTSIDADSEVTSKSITKDGTSIITSSSTKILNINTNTAEATSNSIGTTEKTNGNFRTTDVSSIHISTIEGTSANIRTAEATNISTTEATTIHISTTEAASIDISIITTDGKSIFDENPTHSAQENLDTKTASIYPLYMWIIIALMIVSLLCVLSSFVYMKYFRRISYRCNSDSKVIYHEAENHWESL